MDGGPTIYTIPRYIAHQSARLRWAVLAYALLAPLTIWVPVLFGFRKGQAVLLGFALFIGVTALLQLAPFAAPRTMRRRFRRLTGQVSLVALVVYVLIALLFIVHRGLLLPGLATVALDALLLIYLIVSLPVSLSPRPEDVPRP